LQSIFNAKLRKANMYIYINEGFSYPKARLKSYLDILHHPSSCFPLQEHHEHDNKKKKIKKVEIKREREK